MDSYPRDETAPAVCDMGAMKSGKSRRLVAGTSLSGRAGPASMPARCHDAWVTSSSTADAAFRRLASAVRRLAAQTRGRARTGVTHDDADDEIGTAATDDAIGFNPVPLLRALGGHGARVVVIGQVAVTMHGSRELTGDLDLLWDGDSGQAAALAAGFASAGAELTDDAGTPVACEPAAFSLPKVVFRTARASGDCCTTALNWGDLPVSDFLARARTASGPAGLIIAYLDLPDLILMRRAVGRPKDLRRAGELDRLGRRS